jgi:hypothetical protein
LRRRPLHLQIRLMLQTVLCHHTYMCTYIPLKKHAQPTRGLHICICLFTCPSLYSCSKRKTPSFTFRMYLSPTPSPIWKWFSFSSYFTRMHTAQKLPSSLHMCFSTLSLLLCVFIHYVHTCATFNNLQF